jgi:hypothetical protein
MLVIAPWITAALVDAKFPGRLASLLKTNVKVYVCYGIKRQATENPDPRDEAAKDRLGALARRFVNFIFKRLGNTHAKVLIKDDEFAAGSSFNWLSFKGDPDRTFRDEQGVLIQDSKLVDQKFEELVDRFTEIRQTHPEVPSPSYDGRIFSGQSH